MTVTANKLMYNIDPRDVGIYECPYLRLNYDDDDTEPDVESNRGADAEPDVAPHCCANAEPDAQPHCGADSGAHSGADTSPM